MIPTGVLTVVAGTDGRVQDGRPSVGGLSEDEVRFDWLSALWVKHIYIKIAT
jgi:hypothetical protein